MAVYLLADDSSVRVLGEFFMFTLVYNRGGAMGTNLGSSTYYLVASTLILIFLLYYIYLARADRILSCTLALIAGGALGNIIDRIRLGQVVDFIDVDIPDVTLFNYSIHRWWTFNLADVAITSGIMLLFLRMIMGKHRPPAQESDNRPELL